MKLSRELSRELPRDLSRPSLVGLHSPLTSPCSSALPSPANSRGSSESHLCWICFDDESDELLITNACACKTRLVHASCLATWIQRSNQKECKVCTQKWPSVFLSSEMMSLARPLVVVSGPEPGRPDLACYVISCIFFTGIVYGLLYGVCANTATRQLFVTVIFNVLVIALWNKVCASSEHRSSWHSIKQDVGLLVAAYFCFLVGWVFGYFVLQPDLRDYLLGSIMAHAANCSFCFFVVSLRMFCAATGDEDN